MSFPSLSASLFSVMVVGCSTPVRVTGRVRSGGVLPSSSAMTTISHNGGFPVPVYFCTAALLTCKHKHHIMRAMVIQMA